MIAYWELHPAVFRSTPAAPSPSPPALDCRYGFNRTGIGNYRTRSRGASPVSVQSRTADSGSYVL
eukprot:499827-Prymnesium_polylepis.1